MIFAGDGEPAIDTPSGVGFFEGLPGGTGDDQVFVGTAPILADVGADTHRIDFSSLTDPFKGGGRTITVDVDLSDGLSTRNI